MLSQIEVNVAIISASAPALRPLFKKTFKNTSAIRSKQSGASGSSGAGSESRSRNKSTSHIEMYSSDVTKETGTLPSSANQTRGETIEGSNASEESITGAGGSNGITKTVEMRMDVDRWSQMQSNNA